MMTLMFISQAGLIYFPYIYLLSSSQHISLLRKYYRTDVIFSAIVYSYILNPCSLVMKCLRASESGKHAVE